MLFLISLKIFMKLGTNLNLSIHVCISLIYKEYLYTYAYLSIYIFVYLGTGRLVLWRPSRWSSRRSRTCTSWTWWRRTWTWGTFGWTESPTSSSPYAPSPTRRSTSSTSRTPSGIRFTKKRIKAKYVIFSFSKVVKKIIFIIFKKEIFIIKMFNPNLHGF